MAERLFTSRADPAQPVGASSAGLQAVVGAQMGRRSAEAAQELGADTDGHVARQYLPWMAERADLILVATESHREKVLRGTPMAMRRVFTLREFARLAADVRPDRAVNAVNTADDLRARVAKVASQRGVVSPAKDAEDIADPIGKDLKYTRTVAAEIAGYVDVVVRALGVEREAADG